MTKRIVVCSDGTWNRADQKIPTNVIRFARAISPVAPDDGRTVQVVFYDQGVGTESSWWSKIRGGVFGEGLEKNVEDAYRFLIHNYEEGDEIYLFGFSRGAYTARSTIGLIRNVGLLHKAHADLLPKAYKLYRRRDAHPNSTEAQEFRRRFSREIKIHFIGVWDTVGALGIPITGLSWLTRKKHRFHDVTLSSIVKHAYHALAIDEKRGAFKPSIWKHDPSKEQDAEPEGDQEDSEDKQQVEQVWFAGVHTDIGGGAASPGLPDVAFMWMKEKAAARGLAFDEDYVKATVNPNANGTLHKSRKRFYRILPGWTRELGKTAPKIEAVHPAAVQKRETPSQQYAPENLTDYLASPAKRVAEVEHEF